MASDKIRQLEDNLIFKQMTTAAADKTAVDFLSKPDRRTSKDVHNMLMTAGFTPGLGNVADAADALLYAVEGEFGSAALSATAMIPFIGQAVSAKKALKVAKESGEEMITLWRGVTNIDKHKIIKKGKYISPKNLFGKDPKKEAIKYGIDLSYASEQLKKMARTIGGQPTEVGVWATRKKKDALYYSGKLNKKGDRLLEFEVPKSWHDKYIHQKEKNWFTDGIPREFLKKVHK